MPLRLVNQDRLYPVKACDTIFQIKSMTIGDKERLIRDIQSVPHTGDVNEEKFKRLIGIVAKAIVSIDDYPDEAPKDILEKLEDVDALRTIIKAIIDHCDLSPAEAKNSSSSSEQHIQVSAGSVEKPVD